MKPDELGPIGPIRQVQPRITPSDLRETTIGGSAQRTAAEQPMVERSAETQAGAQPPVDEARVAEIRSAIREGRYPLIPTRVADAIVAAGYLLTEGPQDS